MKTTYLVNRFPVLSETFVAAEIADHFDAGFPVDVVSISRPRPQDSAAPVDPRVAARLTALGTPSFSRMAWLREAPAALADPYARKVLLGARAPGEDRRMWFSFVRRWRAAGLECDVLHAHFGPVGRLAASLKRLGLTRARLVTTFHGHDASAYLRRAGPSAYAELFALGSLFLTVSERWAETLIDAGCPPDRVRVQHMGVDLEALQPPPVRAGPAGDAPLVLSMTGRMVEKKGHIFALQALAALAARRPELRLRLDLVGDGPLRPALERAAGELGLGGAVRFLGAQPHAETLRRLAEADLFLLPSVTAADGDQEGIPVSLMEAMALNLPVVATWHSGVPELVEHGVSGLLAEERDAEGLSRVIEELACDPARRARMGALGRAAVADGFDRRALGRRLREHYAEAFRETEVPPLPRPVSATAAR